MKHRYSVSFVFLIVFIGVPLLYVLNAPTAKVPSVDQAAKQSPAVSSGQNKSDNESEAAVKGAYVDYTAEKVASASGTKILFFHAPWCPQCRAVDEDITKNEVPENVTIFKVDYDTSNDLRLKYGVTLQTTFVRIDAKGDLVKKFVAYNDPTLESVKKNLLQ